MSQSGISRRALLGGAAFGTAAGLIAVPSLTRTSSSPWNDERLALANTAAAATLAESPDSTTTQAMPIRILFNENPLGCSPLARAAAANALQRTQFYPFDIASAVKAKLRAIHGLPAMPESKGLSLKPAEEIGDHTLSLCGGSSELLLAAALAFSVDGGNVVEPSPSYQAVASTAVSRPGPEMQVRQIPLTDGGALDADAMLAACDAKTRILVVTNPNNPTGATLATSALAKLVTQAPTHTLVLVDEAYIDFLDDANAQTAIPLALQQDNVLVTRTFSKIHGLAGLRAGYGIGHKDIFERMRPFQVGSLSLNACGLAAAMASLDDSDFQTKSRSMAADSRKRISKLLTSLGFKVSDSQAACLWADWGRDTAPLVESLASRGILISGGMRWNSPTCVRISVGTDWQTTRLLEGLSELSQA